MSSIAYCILWHDEIQNIPSTLESAIALVNELQKQAARLQAENIHLHHSLDTLRCLIFGSKSEKLSCENSDADNSADSIQQNLFIEKPPRPFLQLQPPRK